MNRIDFDSPKVSQIQMFLNYLYIIGKDNSNIKINNSLVYRELCRYSLTSDDVNDYGFSKDCFDLFDKWYERNKSIDSISKGLMVKYDSKNQHYLQYYSKEEYDTLCDYGEYIKLYIPLKYQNIYDSVNVLFDYIRDSNIKHLSLIFDKIRTDNIIIRLKKDDLDSAIKIINFINNNNTINSNLNKTNPFVPTVNGIGIMYDFGSSYELEISILLSSYINMCISNKIEPSVSDFYKWFKGNNISVLVDNIFAYVIGEKTYIEDNNEIMSDEEKQRLFFDSLKATFLKYNMNQVMLALKLLLEDGNYASFTNGHGPIKYRRMLREKVSKEEAIKIIENFLSSDVDINYQSVLLFCQNLFKKELLKDFYDACAVTYTNYNPNQLKKALKKMITESNSTDFSRYAKDDVNHEKNYRKVIVFYDKHSIIQIIKLFLDLKYIKYNGENVDDLITTFVNNFDFLGYQGEEEISLK